MPHDDRQDVAVCRDPRLAADRVLAQTHDPPERIADGILNGDPNLTAGDEDAVDQVIRVTGVAGGVDRRCGRQRWRQPARTRREVPGEHVLSLGDRLGLCVASNERVGDCQGAGVGRVLEEASLAVEPPDVEGEAGGREENRDRDREDHEDLACLRAIASSRAEAEGAHQLITIVTSPVSLSRPPASCGNSSPTSGMTRSW